MNRKSHIFIQTKRALCQLVSKKQMKALQEEFKHRQRAKNEGTVPTRHGLAPQEDLAPSEAASSWSSEFDNFVWTEKIRKGAFKVPVVLLKFCDLAAAILDQAQAHHQGPGRQRTLLIWGTDGEPYLPRFEHEKLLTRHAEADSAIDVQTADLQELTESFGRLQVVREELKVSLAFCRIHFLLTASLVSEYDSRHSV